ncbi:MAG: hypothetical protein MSG64_13480 [Pyrinomonadaceae bacterium MAG19_C2-C3]|nr:hypothetical protein [Pyrinomonadaceae bacterium MAG19_C2-C3]
MNTHPVQTAKQPHGRKLKFTYVIFAVTILLMILGGIYTAYTTSRTRQDQMPVVALDTVTKALRSFHAQTGRFPKNFREVDARLWKGSKAQQISVDGESLYSPSGNYYYTLHTTNATTACVWAIPVGVRSEEAATHFWYITPSQIERWMGPALSREQIGVVKTVPSEEQLALLVLTRQTASTGVSQPSSTGVFSIFGF